MDVQNLKKNNLMNWILGGRDSVRMYSLLSSELEKIQLEHTQYKKSSSNFCIF